MAQSLHIGLFSDPLITCLFISASHLFWGIQIALTTSLPPTVATVWNCKWSKCPWVGGKWQISAKQHHINSYCWWLKSQTTTQHVWNPVNNGISTISTGGYQLVEDFFHQPYFAHNLWTQEKSQHLQVVWLPNLVDYFYGSETSLQNAGPKAAFPVSNPSQDIQGTWSPSSPAGEYLSARQEVSAK